MKKKIIQAYMIFIMCIACITYVYAYPRTDVPDLYLYASEDYGSREPTLSNLISQLSGFGYAFNYDQYIVHHWYDEIQVFILPSEVVAYVSDTSDSDGGVKYYSFLYLDDYGDVQVYDFSRAGYNTLHWYCSGNYIIQSIKNERVWTFDSTESIINCKLAADYDSAAAYLTTRDLIYLENAENYVDVPAPHDIALYEASNENNIYLYWENTEGISYEVDSITDNSKQTWIEYGYYYENISGEEKLITDDLMFDILPYSRRDQYCIDLAPLEGFENGMVIGTIYNKWSLGGIGSLIESPRVEFFYIPYLDEYHIYYYDEDGNELKLNTYPVNDYGDYNSSFTGGIKPESDLLAPAEGANGEYDFFDYIASGFGLLGSHGLISLIASLFSFFPPEIFMIITAGISAVVGVAVWHMFVKS